VLNRALKKKEISKLINTSFRKCGLRATVVFADQLMQSGFRGDPRRYLDLRGRHAGTATKSHPDFDRRVKSNRSSSNTLRSGDRWRALQQSGRYLGQDPTKSARP
jgi:hypothetical protein